MVSYMLMLCQCTEKTFESRKDMILALQKPTAAGEGHFPKSDSYTL